MLATQVSALVALPLCAPMLLWTAGQPSQDMAFGVVRVAASGRGRPFVAQQLAPRASVGDPDGLETERNEWGERGPTVVVDEAPHVEEIFQRLTAIHAGCNNYRDTGSIEGIIRSEGRLPSMRRTTFSTAFRRPDRFRFEFEDTVQGLLGPRTTEPYVVWREGDEVATYWELNPGVQRAPSLGLALAGATGVSHGAAHTVPRMLMPIEVGGWPLTRLADPRRVADGRIGERTCYRIEGTTWTGKGRTRLWIDTRTFLLLRVDERTRLDGALCEETTLYQPTITGRVPDELLEFRD